MQCPMCKQLRHPGPCDPVYEDDDAPDLLEVLAMDAVAARSRYFAEKKRVAEGRSKQGVVNEHRG